MSDVTKNALVRGASGDFNKQFVYRTRGNKTTMAKMPTYGKDRVTTPKQEQIRDLFASAAMYAESAMSSVELQPQYDKKSSKYRSARNIAFRDFLKAPRVISIDVENYTGTPDSAIAVTAKDDFRVARVTVSIYTEAGVLVEQGDAVQHPINRSKWIYTATAANTPVAGSRILAMAFDLPENRGELEISV
ncbi:MAG TPA: hypothetical protein VFM90_12690 [Cyclobacteriaceae bacterium]|nr:hypothetical protein [Cyclobacteriaceae bacterium]